MSKGSESYVFLSFASALFNQNFAAMVPMKSSILKIQDRMCGLYSLILGGIGHFVMQLTVITVTIFFCFRDG